MYVHQDADLGMAELIAYNAKVQRPGVCNAAETLLVHRDVAGELLPSLLAKLSEAGVGSSGTSGREVRRVGARGRGDGAGLGHRVPRAEDGGRGRRFARRRGRSHQSARDQALGCDRHRV